MDAPVAGEVPREQAAAPEAAVTSDAVTSDMVIERATALAPRLRERAERCASERRVPAETIADYHDAGFFRLAQPRRYGGYEMGWDVQCRMSQILAEADGSQAWIACIVAGHAQMVGTFPAEAQDEVWGKNERAVIAASFDPNGRATRMPGGFRFSGRHKFASGIDYSQWLICGGYIVEGDKREGPHFFLVPTTDVTVIDDWDALGLEGTGSKSFTVNDVFLPQHRMLDGELARIGAGPGTAVNSAPIFRTPRGGITSTGFASVSVGMAKSVLEEWLLLTGPRKSRDVAVAHQPGSLFAAAEASAAIDAAEALYVGTITSSMRILEAGGKLDDFDLLTARRNVSYACKLVLEAGYRLFSASGAHALFNNLRLSQQYRNLLASGAHFAVSWDAHAPAYGKKLLERYVV